MDQAADMECEKSQGPQNNQDDQNRFKHAASFFGFDPALDPGHCLGHRELQKTIFIFAIFMPGFSELPELQKILFSLSKKRNFKQLPCRTSGPAKNKVLMKNIFEPGNRTIPVFQDNPFPRSGRNSSDLLKTVFHCQP
jgi:hypothetical protein